MVKSSNVWPRVLVYSSLALAAIAVIALVVMWQWPQGKQSGKVTPRPVFSVSVRPASGSVAQGGEVAATVSVKGRRGYKKGVTLVAGQRPVGVTVTFARRDQTKPPFSSAVTLKASADLPTGKYRIVITGVDADNTARRFNYELTVTASSATTPEAVTAGEDLYAAQVAAFKGRYGKTDEWEQWMLANRSRYEPPFLGARQMSAPAIIAFRYENPIAYDPPWTSENEHMAALDSTAELTYIGYDFRFVFGGDTTTSYANAIGGIRGTSSASGKNVYLYYETIFNHEFAHVLRILHHYDSEAAAGAGQHMPPGETKCLMDRTSNQFCSGCRTALNIPLDVNNQAASEAAINEILRRYPY